MRLADAVDDLAPAHPPCYINRQSWLQYLKSAAAAQAHKDEPKVIVIIDDEPAFNRSFPFCIDCTDANRDSMSRSGRCKPDHLTNMEPVNDPQISN